MGRAVARAGGADHSGARRVAGGRPHREVAGAGDREAFRDEVDMLWDDGERAGWFGEEPDSSGAIAQSPNQPRSFSIASGRLGSRRRLGWGMAVSSASRPVTLSRRCCSLCIRWCSTPNPMRMNERTKAFLAPMAVPVSISAADCVGGCSSPERQCHPCRQLAARSIMVSPPGRCR